MNHAVCKKERLTVEQNKVLVLPINRRMLIKGPAGSGKSTVAAYRALSCAQNPELGETAPKVLVLAYNRGLVDHFLERMIHSHPDSDSVDVMDLHQLAHSIAPVKMNRGDEDRVLMSVLKELTPMLDGLKTNPAFATGDDYRTRKFYLDEFGWMFGEMFEKESDYLEAQRTGRGPRAALAGRRYMIRRKEDRPFIWRAFRLFEKRCREQGIETFDMSVKDAYVKASKLTGTYRFLVIDEAQDFPPLWMKLALTQVNLDDPRTGLTLVASDRQQIYGRDSSWAHRLGMKTERHALHGNFRNPEDIQWLAEAFYKTLNDAEDDEPSGAEAKAFAEKHAVWVHGRDLAAVNRYVRDRFGKTAGTVVLTPTTKAVPEFDGLPATTWRKFKGGEAETVILHGLSEWNLPGDSIFEEDKDLFRKNGKLFYTMLTRARRQLVLVSEDGRESSFLKTLMEVADGRIEEVRV